MNDPIARDDEGCTACDDTGEVDCPECDGSGMDDDGEVCDLCEGSGTTNCPECG